MLGDSLSDSNPLFERYEGRALREQLVRAFARVPRHYVHVIVRNGLTARNPIVLVDVEPHRFERIVYGVGHSSHQTREGVGLGLGEV